MRIVLQRVLRACVRVNDEVVGEVGCGFLALIGVDKEDTEDCASVMAKKTATIRVFQDTNGKLNRNILDIHGSVLVVSQFTLLADLTHGRRPSFYSAAPKEQARSLIAKYVAGLTSMGIFVEEGRFGESMKIELVNDGPVTIVLDSDYLER